MKRESKIKLLVLLLAASALAYLAGCVQPFDKATGEKVGAVQSVFAPRPATNPANGDPVAVRFVKPSRDDVANGVEAAGEATRKVAPFLPAPWDSVALVIAGAAVPLITGQLRKKKSTMSTTSTTSTQ